MVENQFDLQAFFFFSHLDDNVSIGDLKIK